MLLPTSPLRLFFYIALIISGALLPLYRQWNEFRERRDDLEFKCNHYHGNIQAFLERCFLFEKGLAEENHFRWQDAEYHWYLLVLILIEPCYLLMKKIHRQWLYNRDSWREKERLKESGELEGLTFQRESHRIRYF